MVSFVICFKQRFSKFEIIVFKDPIMRISVSGPGEFWASRNDFSKFEKISPATWDVFLTSFAKNESFYRRISTKYQSSKLFWRILEDNKQILMIYISEFMFACF